MTVDCLKCNTVTVSNECEKVEWVERVGEQSRCQSVHLRASLARRRRCRYRQAQCGAKDRPTLETFLQSSHIVIIEAYEGNHSILLQIQMQCFIQSNTDNMFILPLIP